jgi:hypothetical protein
MVLLNAISTLMGELQELVLDIENILLATSMYIKV